MAALGFSEVKTLVAANNKSQTLSDEFVVCMIWKECGFRPRAEDTGSTTARGMMQMTKGAVHDVNANYRASGAKYTLEDMDDNAKNVACATLYLDLRIRWAGGDVAKGVNGYGTGSGYSTNITACEACLKASPGIGMDCLKRIHP